MTIDHIGIAVRSIDDALGFYQDTLGIEPSHRTIVEHEKVEAAVIPVGNCRIELLQPVSQDSVIARFLNRKGEGMHHIAMEVDDLDASAKAVHQAGRRLVNDKIQIGAEGYRYVFVHPADTGGVLLELVERKRETGTRTG